PGRWRGHLHRRLRVDRRPRAAGRAGGPFRRRPPRRPVHRGPDDRGARGTGRVAAAGGRRMSVVTIPLAAAPNEMVQEEILKLVAHVSRDVAAPRFLENGAVLGFDYLGEEGNREAIRAEVEAVATKIQRSLRRLERKVVHRTPTGCDHRPGEVTTEGTGIWVSGQGQVQLSDGALRASRRL